jgi:serine/threonine protein kinase
LALTIATAVHELHSSRWLHKEIHSFNIVFLYSNDSPTVSIQEPYMTGFSYARSDAEEVVSPVVSFIGKDIYMHPDLRGGEQDNEGQQVPRFKRTYDIYSLGLVLLEIRLWDSVSTFNTNLVTQKPSLGGLSGLVRGISDTAWAGRRETWSSDASRGPRQVMQSPWIPMIKM